MVKLILNKSKNGWETTEDKDNYDFALDGFLYDSYKAAKKVMEKKSVDLPTAVAGYPGTGKSTETIKLASFCDPTFDHTRMYQKTEDFIEGLKNSTPLTAHVLDESYDGMNASEIRRETGRALMNVMNIIRQKRLYIFILLPNFFDLHKSIAVFRTRWLIYCYSKSFGDIGYFAAFDRETKQQLYIKGKKEENYNCVKADFYGSFSKKLPPNFDWEAYEKMKDEGLQNVFVSTQEDRTSLNQRDKLIYYLHNKFDHTTQTLSEITGISLRHVQRIIRTIKKLEADKKNEQ